MNTITRTAALNKFRTASNILRQTNMKVLVVNDVQLKSGDTPHIPLVINYGELSTSLQPIALLTGSADLPKAVEEYSLRLVELILQWRITLIRVYYYSVAPAIASNYSRAGIVVNFVTATGGDVEMLRSIECFYK
jgi:translation initiation factor 4A